MEGLSKLLCEQATHTWVTEAYKYPRGFGGENVNDEGTTTKAKQQEDIESLKKDATKVSKKPAKDFEAWMGESQFLQAIQGLFWKDSSLNIQWPVKFPMVSEEEARFPNLPQFVPEYATE